MQKNMKLGNMKQSSRSSNDSFHLTFGRRQSVHIGESSLRARTGNSVKVAYSCCFAHFSLLCLLRFL